MRVVMFRGKTPDGKWAYGNLVYMHGTSTEWTIGIQMVSGDGYRPWSSINVIPETIGQYTGLKDKNHISIYDGDILSAEGGKFKFLVSWNDKHCCFTCVLTHSKIREDDNMHYHLLSNMRLDICVVAGNMYDNPELLE